MYVLLLCGIFGHVDETHEIFGHVDETHAIFGHVDETYGIVGHVDENHGIFGHIDRPPRGEAVRLTALAMARPPLLTL